MNLPRATRSWFCDVGLAFASPRYFFAHAGLNVPDMYIELALSGKLKDKPKSLNALPENLYWIRMIDMGFKLVEDGEWTSQKI